MDPYQLAHEITDEVLGDGTYADLHRNNPNPNIRAEARRGEEKDDEEKEN